MLIVNLLAVALSPLIAVLVTVWLQARKERRDAKRWVFQTLISTRHRPITDEAVRALNMIDVVFHDSQRVRQLWREYFDMLCGPAPQNLVGFQQRQVKNLEMITEMAKVLGYGRTIRDLDVDRVYYPVGLGQQDERANAISSELLRVLEGTEGLTVLPRSRLSDAAPEGATLPGQQPSSLAPER